MREIIFKAKRTDNGEWVEGYYVKKEHGQFRGSCILANNTPESVSIGYTDVIHYMVDPETVCQYTGLTDKNGNKIWEGSIIKYVPTNTILQVVYINGAFAVTYMANAYSPINWEIEGEGEYYDFGISNDYLTRSEVLGNIFDNPELLTK